MIVNSSDKVLRLYSRSEESHLKWELANEIVDTINKLQWKCTGFTRDADYIVAGTAERAEHNVYFWHRAYGDIVKTLEGPKEGLMSICVSEFVFVGSL